MRNTLLISICAAMLLAVCSCHPAITMAQSVRGATASTNPNIHVATVPENQVTAILYVDGQNPNASDSGSGTQQKPFQTIGAAAVRAERNNARRIGTKVLINPGVYREQISIPIPSNGSTAPMVFEAQTPGTVVIDGSDLWNSGWQHQSGTLYSHYWPYEWGLAPYPPDWQGNVILEDIVRRREMVFVNGQPMTQVLSQNALANNSFFVSESNATLYLQLDPNTSFAGANIEVSTRAQVLRAQGVTNLVLRGLTFQRGNPAVPDGEVEIVDSQTVLIDTCNFLVSNWIGLNLETTNDLTVQSSVANYNGETGIEGYRLKRLLLQDSETSYNNWRGAEGEFLGWDAAGSKLGAVHDAVILRYRSLANQARGLWLDFDTVNLTLNTSDIGQNNGDGLFIEANEGPITVQSNYFHENTTGVAGATSTDIWILSNYIWANGQTQILITGDFVRAVSNWETNAQYNLSAARWSIQGNLIQSQSANQPWLLTPHWQPFLSTVGSDKNYWLRPLDLRGFSVGGNAWSLQNWQESFGVDLDSLAGMF